MKRVRQLRQALTVDTDNGPVQVHVTAQYPMPAELQRALSEITRAAVRKLDALELPDPVTKMTIGAS